MILASDFSGSGGVEAASYRAAIITPVIVDKGIVLAYTDLGGDSGWYALPLTLPAGFGHTVTQTFSYDLASFTVYLMHNEGTGSAASIFDGHRIKIVAVPPVATTAVAAIETKDYASVMRVLQAAQ